MIAITIVRPGCSRPPRQPSLVEHADARPRPSSSTGNASMMSITREISVSTQPRKKPAIMPIVTPMATDRPVPTKRHDQRDLGAGEHAGEDVAPDRVHAHQVLARRPGRQAEQRVQRGRRGLVGRWRADELADRRREDRRDDQQHDERQGGQRHLVLAKAPPEELQRRPRGHRRVARDDRVDAVVLGVQQIAGACSSTQILSPLEGGSGSLVPRTDEQPTPCPRTTMPVSALGTPVCPRQESNLHPALRRRVLYPLSYEGAPGSVFTLDRGGPGTRRRSSPAPHTVRRREASAIFAAPAREAVEDRHDAHHVVALGAHRLDRLTVEPPRGHHVLDDQAALARRQRRALDLALQAVGLGVLAHEEGLHVRPARQRGASGRVGAHRHARRPPSPPTAGRSRRRARRPRRTRPGAGSPAWRRRSTARWPPR